MSSRQGTSERPSDGEADLRREIAELRVQLAEALETLDAIRSGEVDAVVVGGPENRRVYTLETADRSYRLLVEQIREGAVILGPAGQILYANPALSQMLGASNERLIGQPFTTFVAPDDQNRFVGLMAQRGRGEITLTGGEELARPALISLDQFTTEDGSIMCGVITDLTEARAHALQLSAVRSDLAAESARRERDERYRLILEGATDYAIIVIDTDARVSIWSAGACSMFGWTAEEVIGGAMPDIWSPADVAAAIPAREVQLALEHGRTEEGRWYVRRDGSPFWATAIMMPLRNDGVLVGYLKIMRDETERRRAEENRQVLVNELNHRVKNTLAVVQSITTLTLRSTASLQQASTAIADRLVALSRAHDVLTRESWEGAWLSEIVEQAVGAFRHLGHERIHVFGDDLRVKPRVALALSMVLQELATNAAKYGALSSRTGEVAIRWRVDGSQLDVLWEESGGPPVEPPARRGFGSRLIERSIGPDLGGAVGLEFPPEGVRCTMRCSML